METRVLHFRQQRRRRRCRERILSEAEEQQAADREKIKDWGNSPVK